MRLRWTLKTKGKKISFIYSSSMFHTNSESSWRHQQYYKSRHCPKPSCENNNKKKKWIRPLPTNVQYATQPMCWETTNWIRQKLIQTLIQTLRRPLLCVVLHLVLHRPPSVWRLEAPYIPPPTLPMLYELYAFLATHPCHPHFPDHHLPHLAKVPHRQIIT